MRSSSLHLLWVSIMVALTASVAGAWRADFDGPMNDGVLAVAFDPSGDVLAAGVADEDSLGCSSTLRVLKLGRVDGHVVWEATRASGSLDLATHVAVDARGDVLVGGLTGECVGYYPGSLTVLKLDGATGGVLWTYLGATAATPRSLAVDRAGAVLVGGPVPSSSPEPTGASSGAETISRRPRSHSIDAGIPSSRVGRQPW